MSNLESIEDKIGFTPCGEDCACAQEALDDIERGVADGEDYVGWASFGGGVESIAEFFAEQAEASRKEDNRHAIASYARTLETVSKATLILGELINDEIVGYED